MTTSDEAVRAIRHAVQEHGNEGTRLGGPAAIGGMEWFGRLAGWSWPRTYIDVLGQHDGVWVQSVVIFRFLESVEAFLLLHDSWHRPAGFWPIASDGCGNYFALALGLRGRTGESPVVFFDMMESRDNPAYTVADSYAEFVVVHLREECERAGCSGPLNQP